jgi:hypothetical protein
MTAAEKDRIREQVKARLRAGSTPREELARAAPRAKEFVRRGMAAQAAVDQAIRKTKLPNLAKLPEPAARPTRHGRAKDLAAVTHIARKVERRNRDAQGHLLPSKVTPRPQK